MTDLGLEVTSNMNERLSAVINSVGRSGEYAQKVASILAGTSFDKKIISSQGVQYADNEIARARMLRDSLIALRRNADDALFALNEYLRKCSTRRKEGIDRINEQQAKLDAWPVIEEHYDEGTETDQQEER
jgi:hypothetical protein